MLLNIKTYFRLSATGIFALLITGFALAGPGLPHVDTRQKAAKPNIVIIMADQWNAQSLGYAGNKDVKTPNLDQLAQRSVVFKTAVSVMPVCSPARASLLTGQYPLTHGVFYNDRPLRNEALTIAEIYKTAGYATGYIGKWHVNGQENYEKQFAARNRAVPRERRQGFDYWKAREVTHDYNSSFYFDENNVRHDWPGYDVFPQTDSAISFIDKNKGNPFLLVLSWGPPHDPYLTAPEEYRKLYQPEKLRLRPNVPDSLKAKARKDLAGYYAHCTALDKSAGDLLAALKRAGVEENTIVVFTSDHGDMLYSQGKVRKQKPWDESLLVPLIVHYPAGLGLKKRELSMPFSSIDILPTLLGMSGMEIPKPVEGQNFAAVLEGKKVPKGDEAALIQLPVPFHENNFLNGGKEYRAIRTQQYTYVRDLNGPWLMYDNFKDPHQLKNLIGQPQHASTQAKLERTLKSKLIEAKDKFLTADEYMQQWKYRYDGKDSTRAAEVKSKGKRPNIIFLLTDDHRWDALGVMGNKIIQTPNLDALANRGVLFKKAYVTTAICMVSRASLLSGQYMSRHKINDFNTDFKKEALSQTYPASLKEAGYKLGFIGKWGIDVQNQPDSLYDYWAAAKEGQPKYELVNKSGKVIHHTDSVGKDIKHFLGQFAGKEPFCLAVSFKAPHELDGNPPTYPVQERFKDLYKNVSIPDPVTADPKYWNNHPDFFKTDANIGRDRWKPLLSTPELRAETTKDYYRLITGVDEVVGDLVTQLKQLKIDENTIIIFMGDNGFSLGEHGLEGKWFGFEESIRVPLIISGAALPANLKHVQSNNIALNIDVAPTILSLAGVSTPGSMQGQNLIKSTQSKPAARKDFFYEHTFMGSPRLPKVEGVVTADFKYMKYIEHGYEELYNTLKDPHETVNLAKNSAYAGKLAEMRKRYEELKVAVR
jgi:arylsulfatase A-like enzyme